MSDSSNLIPTYLAEIWNRAIPDPVDDNSPFQGFSSPLDEVTVADEIDANLFLPAEVSFYGVMLYGVSPYGFVGNAPLTSETLETSTTLLTGVVPDDDD